VPSLILVNETTVLSDEDILPVKDALQIQLSRDLMMYWGKSSWLGFVGRNKPLPTDPSLWFLYLKDNSDEDGALGYHDRTPSGQPVGYSFVKTDIEEGASWSVTLSHELLEMIVDPWTVFASQGLYKGRIVWRALEICDPCEDDSQGYEINGIKVSDFVTPKYFQDDSKVGLYDFKGLINKPGVLLANGYQSIFDKGKWTDIVAQHAPGYKPPFEGSRRWLRQIRTEQKGTTS
jgi:hypothetical protein